MTIDYENILKIARIKQSLSAYELNEYSEDPSLIDEAISSASRVLTVGWEPDNFGHGGVHRINYWANQYFCISSDYDSEGPFDTLENALSNGWFENPIPNPSIDSETLSLEYLQKIGQRLIGGDGHQVEINGTIFQLVDGRLIK